MQTFGTGRKSLWLAPDAQGLKEGKTMVARRAFVGALGALAGLVLGAATLSAMGGSRVEYLTFSGPVGLPGVTLHAGTYSFETLDGMGSTGVVRVLDKATRQSVFLGFTLPADRPAGAKNERSIVLGESSRGVPPPIVAWYPNGDRHGRSFIYPSN
jgi:hypothetical protein